MSLRRLLEQQYVHSLVLNNKKHIIFSMYQHNVKKYQFSYYIMAPLLLGCLVVGLKTVILAAN